ncbi:MAG TPA: flagellar basal body-associated FliL family protein [Acidimicrobiales bacterium]
MAKKKKTDKGDDAKDEAKQGKGKTIGLAVAFAVIGAVVGPKVMGGGSASAEASAPTTTTTVAGPVVVLDAVTLNLSDGRLLQVGLALELSAEAGSGGGEEEVDESDPTKGYAKALDAAIGVFGHQTMAALSEPGGRDAAKVALEASLDELYHGEIVGVYFHQFVMQ